MPCCIVTARRGLLSLDNVFTVNGHEPTTHPVAQVTIEKGAVPMGTAPFVLGKTLCLVVLVQAAAVIGGASLAGGRGAVTGTLLGTVLMVLITNAGTAFQIDPYILDVTTGVLIIFAVAMDMIKTRKKA